MNHYKILAFSAATACLCFYAGCAPQRSLTARDGAGVSIALSKPAGRIVSTMPSNTEILYALGLQDRVVGLTAYCGKTCDTRGKVIIGGWVSLDCEKIRALQPDLILAFGGAQTKYHAALREIAPTFVCEPTTVAETLQAVLDIGRLTQREQPAQAIVKAQNQQLARIQARLASLPPHARLRVARVFGTNTNVMTAGGKSILTDIIKLAGGTNVFGNIDDDYFTVAFERLAALDPDVLIVHGEKTEADEKRAAFGQSPDFSRLRAVKNGKVLVYSCDNICHPNAAVAQTVALVAQGLHPERFDTDQPDYEN